METWVTVVAALIVVVIVALLVVAYQRRRRTEQLKERFGPEYDRAVTETGDRRHAESELAQRQRRRSTLDIRPLGAEARERYATAWQETQIRFVDDPSGAVGQADALVTRVMADRGYPMDDFDTRSADISVDHPDVVDNYRTAHAVSLANDHGHATTEDLREAMVCYRSLFERLLDDTVDLQDHRRHEGVR